MKNCKHNGSFFFLHHFGPCIAGNILLNSYHCNAHNNLITYFIIGKKEHDTNKQCTTLISDLCTVLDEAFGRFIIERCWDIWFKECKEELNKNDFSYN